MPTVALKRRRGKPTDELLAYNESRGVWRDVTSTDINQWLKDLLGQDFTAKDFRTWNGTVLAAMCSPTARTGGSRQGCRRDGQGRRRDPRQHPGRCPRLLRRPPRDLEVRARQDDQGHDGSPGKAGGSKEFADREGIEKAVIRLISLAGGVARRGPWMDFDLGDFALGR